MKKEIDDIMVMLGGEVKALGEGKVGGYLVVFSSQKEPDLAVDWFDTKTDFDANDGERATILYDHGFDDTLKARKLGNVQMKMLPAGVWVEGQLELRDEYEEKIYELVKAKKLGWSSGVPAHLVRRTQTGKSYHVDSWPLGKDASLTPTPAEPRTLAVSLKSIEFSPMDWAAIVPEVAEAKDDVAPKPEPVVDEVPAVEPEPEPEAKADEPTPSEDAVLVTDLKAATTLEAFKHAIDELKTIAETGKLAQYILDALKSDDDDTDKEQIETETSGELGDGPPTSPPDTEVEGDDKGKKDEEEEKPAEPSVADTMPKPGVDTILDNLYGEIPVVEPLPEPKPNGLFVDLLSPKMEE